MDHSLLRKNGAFTFDPFSTEPGHVDGYFLPCKVRPDAGLSDAFTLDGLRGTHRAKSIGGGTRKARCLLSCLHRLASVMF